MPTLCCECQIFHHGVSGHEVPLLASYFLLRLNISCPDEVNFINLVLDRLFEMDRAITQVGGSSVAHTKCAMILSWINADLLPKAGLTLSVKS